MYALEILLDWLLLMRGEVKLGIACCGPRCTVGGGRSNSVSNLTLSLRRRGTLQILGVAGVRDDDVSGLGGMCPGWVRLMGSEIARPGFQSDSGHGRMSVDVWMRVRRPSLRSVHHWCCESLAQIGHSWTWYGVEHDDHSDIPRRNWAWAPRHNRQCAHSLLGFRRRARRPKSYQNLQPVSQIQSTWSRMATKIQLGIQVRVVKRNYRRLPSFKIQNVDRVVNEIWFKFVILFIGRGKGRGAIHFQ